MPKNSLLRETLDRLVAQLVDGALGIVREAIASRVILDASMAPVKPDEIGKHVVAHVDLEEHIRRRAQFRPPPTLKRESDVPKWDHPPRDDDYSRRPPSIFPSTAVTDPELLLAAMANSNEVPTGFSSPAEDAPEFYRARPREPKHLFVDTSESQATPDYEAGPAVGKDEVIVRTARGGVVLRRKKELSTP